MALDKTAGDTLFNLSKKAPKPHHNIPDTPIEEPPLPAPKWQQLEKVTVLLTEEQKAGLDRLAKKIMRYRSPNKQKNSNRERITTNTLLRALVDNFLSHSEQMEMQVMETEKDVLDWIRKAL